VSAYAGCRVLVTGGAGFVASALVTRLVEAGADVTVLDDLSTGRAAAMPAEASLVEGSVADARLVRELVAAHPLVFHFAARGIVASTRNPRDDFETNAAGTLNMLLAARECGVDRIVCASSASVYGNPHSIPIDEDDRLTPLSPYAVSKLTGEHYCLAFYESYGVPTTVLRLSNVYGPGQRPDNPYAGVIPRFVSSALEGRPLAVHGDGQQTRDFTFVDDAVEAALTAGVHPRAEGEVFNVGTGAETSVLDLAERIAAALGAECRVTHVDRRDIDNIRRRVLNIEKIRRMVRWSPRTPLDPGLRRTVESLASRPVHG
jgi:UDP-glucose 4-epimerase